MIEFNTSQNAKVLELGGGDNPQAVTTCNVDARPGPKVSFTCDFNEFPWPIQSEEFDAVLSFFMLEHLSFLNTEKALKEILRVLKPGGRFVGTVPNTEAQIKWILSKSWEKLTTRKHDGDFVEASRILFGAQQFNNEISPYNFHAAYFSPDIVIEMFQRIGFDSVVTQPYGQEIGTDLYVTATKPMNTVESFTNTTNATGFGREIPPLGSVQTVMPLESPQMPLESVPMVNRGVDLPKQSESVSDGKERKETVSADSVSGTSDAFDSATVFSHRYWDGGHMGGGFGPPGYRDFPVHHTTTQLILNRYRPDSVLELGASRGYIVKRLQDAGVRAVGIDVSRHCWLTRVADPLHLWDVRKTPWPIGDERFSHAISLAFFEHIPEQDVDKVIAEMAKYCERGVHGIDFGTNAARSDKTKVTLKDKRWWTARMPKGHEVVDKNELEPQVQFDESFFVDPEGKVKLNVGSGLNGFYQGWTNLDIEDNTQWMQQNGLQFKKHDMTTSLPFDTGSVHAIFEHHSLEHITLREGLQHLRDCRRVLNPETGAMRIVVPNAAVLTRKYLENSLDYYDECNHGCQNATTSAGKLWSILGEGHKAAYDEQTLLQMLHDSGFEAGVTQFRQTCWNRTGFNQILAETQEHCYGDDKNGISLFIDAIPAT